MTDNTHGQVPEALIDLIDTYAETRHRYGRIHNARTEAARKAVIEALGGMQALSAAPAEKQAAPKAAPGEQNTVPAEWLEQAYREGWAACRDAETIGEEAEDWAFGNSTANSRMIDAQQAAPQQEAQEPVALLVRKNSWRAGQWEAAPPDSPSYGLAWANQRQYVYAAPQPAPLSDDVVKDAARYRWLREGNDAKHGAAWHVAVNLYGCEWDAAIDAAIAAQGGKV